MANKRNIFSKATDLKELEEMYEQAEEEGKYNFDTVQRDYAEMRNNLLGVRELQKIEHTEDIEYFKETGKPAPAGNAKRYAIPPNSPMTLAWVSGNKELPYFTPVFGKGNYQAVPQNMIKTADVISGAFFRDYIPYIGKTSAEGHSGLDILYIRDLSKESDLVQLEEDMEIRYEEGEELQLQNAFIVANFDTVVKKGSHIYTVVQTMLLNPQNNHIRWKMISMFAMHNGILEQLKFKADKSN